MLANYVRRSLSFLLALTMLFSVVPAQAFATEEDGHDHVHEEEIVISGDAALTAAALEEETHAHSYTSVATPATCGAAGFTTYTCACGDTYTADEVPATGAHDYQVVEEVAATVDAEGYVNSVCTVCGAEDQKVLEKLTPAEQPTEPKATEPVPTESTPVEEEPSEPVVAEPSALALDLTARINAIVADYGIKPGMTDNEVANQIFPKDGDAIKATMDEIAAIDAVEDLTEGDLEYIVANAELNAYERFCDVFAMLMNPMAITDVDLLDGKIRIGDNQNTGSGSGTTYKATVTSSVTTRKTSTITITNLGSKRAEISFAYSVSNLDKEAGAFSLESSNASGSGSGNYTKVLDAGGQFQFTFRARRGLGDRTATLNLTNISYTEIAENANITFQYDSTLGSITVGGTAVADGNTVTVPGSGAALVATAKSGASFLGWMDTANNKLISSAASYNLMPTGNTTVKAVFASTTPWFYVAKADGDYLYDSWSAATAAAAEATNKAFVLANNATLPAGGYEIPSGVILLIPFDAANTLYTTEPGRTGSQKYVSPTVFRTLTMADGANITVKGALCVCGMQSADQSYAGHPTGPLGFIKMNSNSTITVENGANLYVWGYITGSGSVEAKSGATVYEDFQLTDFRGGDATSQMPDNTQGVFPMSQYYMQNIEVPLTLYAGAKEYANMSVDVTLVGIQGTNVPVVSSASDTEAMFRLSNGYIKKDYKEGTGRLEFVTAGDFSINPISMGMNMGMYGNVTINSDKLNLPIPGHMTVDAISGTVSINQSLALLPGAQLYIRQGVTGTLASGKRIVIYDVDDWGTYCRHSNDRWIKLPYVPGGNGIEGRETDAMVQVDGFVNASGAAVYTTAGGANITSTGTGKVTVTAGTETVTYQVTQSVEQGLLGDSQKLTYVEIPLTPAKLKNADGTYIQTATGTYTYRNKFWHNGDCADGEDKNHKCDVCSAVLSQCEDTEKDHICDYCGGNVGEHIDADKNHACDYGCAVTFGKCEDTNKDHICDYVGCQVFHGTHADADNDGDHVCDYGCKEVLESCSDKTGDGDHNCDVCGAENVTEHTYSAATCEVPATCSECNATTGTELGHIDENTDHKCDRECGKTDMNMDKHVDAADDADHVCDYGCKETLEECSDKTGDGDHNCDVCGAEKITEHTYSAATCEIPATCSECNATTGTELGHIDENTDHKCDRECGKTDMNMDKHVDAADDSDHVCDYGCNATLEACSDATGDGDHNCDVCGAENVTEHTYSAATCEIPATCSECNVTTGTELGHIDENTDHKCDRNCGKTGMGTHSDAADDGDHVCDYGCNATLEACSDVETDGDHNCDVCGAEDVTSHDYTTEVTAATCTEQGYTTYTCNCGHTYTADEVAALGHKDENKDHACDNGCDVYQGKHEDSATDKDHVCDYCGKAVENGETCSDVETDKDHNCDVCDAKDVTEHSYTTEVTAATCTEKGYTTYTCNCGHSYKDNYQNEAGHSHTSEITTQPDCENDGVETFTCHCGDTYTKPVEKLGHDWGAVAVKWSDDYSTATAKRTCERTGCTAFEEETVNTTSMESVKADCVTAQQITYTAAFKSDWIEEKTRTITITYSVDENIHSFGTTTYTWADNGTACTAQHICTRCQKSETAEATMSSSRKTPGNCVTPDKLTWTATFNVGWAVTQTGEYDGNVVENGHDWGDVEYVWSNDGTQCTAVRVCTNSGEHKQEQAGTMTSEVTTEATCTQPEIVTYTATFTDWAKETKTNDVIGATKADVHSWNDAVVTWAEDGSACTTVRTCAYNPEHKQEATAEISSEVTTTPTCTTKKVTTYTAKFNVGWATAEPLKITGDVDANNHAWGETAYKWNDTTKTCTASRTCGNKNCPVGTETADADMSDVQKTAPTCVQKEVRTYTATFDVPWAKDQTMDYEGSVDKNGHAWGATTYNWDKDAKTCTASHTCGNEGCPVGTETANADMTSVQKTAPTCVQEEVRTYTATFDADWAETQTADLEGDVNENAHDWAGPTYTWESATEPCTAVRVCKNSAEHTQTATAKITHGVTTEADCITKEVVTYTADFEETWAEDQTMDVIGKTNPDKHDLVYETTQDATCTEEGTAAGSHCKNCDYKTGGAIIPAKGHDWSKTEYIWSEDNLACTAKRTCSRDASHVETLDATVTVTSTEATCSAPDVTTYTAVFAETKDNWAVTQIKEITGAIASEKHDWNATDYAWTENGTVGVATRTCKYNGGHVETATVTMSQEITTVATCTQPEVITYTADFAESWAETQTNPVTGSVKDDAHQWSTEIDYNWSEDGKVCTASRACAYDQTHVDTAEAVMTFETTTTATCVKPEVVTYTATFTGWAEAVKANPVVGNTNANAHDWADADVVWAEDGSSCTAQRFCKNKAEHVENATAKVTSSTTTATCTHPAVTTFTAAFDVDWASAEPKVITGSVNETAHSWNETEYHWNEAGTVCEATRTCKHNSEHVETATVTMSSKVKVKATCTVQGVVTYTAAFAESWAKTQTNDVIGSKDSNNHKWSNAEYNWSEDGTSCTAIRVCAYDKTHVETAKVTMTSDMKQEATCTVKGITTYTATFEEDWTVKTLSNDVIGDYNKDNHKNIITDEAEDPTCTETGLTEGSHCGNCKEVLVVQNVVPVLIHIDENHDHKCDRDCGKNDMNMDRHVDADTDHKCDYGCEENIGTCEDADKDHHCDYGCDDYFGEHVDADKNHACDYGCTESIGTCEDADKDHHCDYGCDHYFGEHKDENTDHACDYGCTESIGTCEDADKDHHCDYGCDNYFGEHKDENTDHACDYGCTESIGTCEDADKDHHCDYGCDNYFGEHVDADKDHDCDYGCKEDIGTCEDKDLDHKCDYGCDKPYGTCEDKNLDHKCDYGCDKPYGTCEDKDLDHKCDYGCDKPYGTCEDKDLDHKCDYGCDEPYGTCEDKNLDHKCDYGCDKSYGTCEDKNLDHKCDYGCDKPYGTCEDKDLDHKCDYGCDKPYGTCEDKNLDHKCDYGCDKSYGTCEDKNLDHKCDYGCDKPHGTCEDKNLDHKCDYGCDQTYGIHADSANDDNHVCDYGCGAVLESCSDKTGDQNHACDICGAENVTTHTYADATCIAPKTCTECGATEGEKLGHNEVIDEAVAATCTAPGKTEGKHCDRCGEVLVAQTEIQQLEHEMLPATCTEPSKCKHGCGLTEGEKLGHNEVIDEEVPAFCEEDGLEEGKHCDRCGEVLVAQKVIPMLGHDIVTHEAKKPTYSNVGWEAYEECTRCAYTTYVEIPKLEVPPIEDYETFLMNLGLLEEIAYAYMLEHPGVDPANLVIKYIRTGVDRYNSGSWGIMAGYEDAGFAQFVSDMEDMINSEAESEDHMLCVTSMKNIKNFDLPNGDHVDLGHMFGTMDITYHNKFGINHADVAGWAGDLVDLLSTTDRHNVSGSLEEMVADISANYLCHGFPGESDLFTLEDMYGDLDGYYVMQQLQSRTYETGTLTAIMQEYFTEDLTIEDRAEYFLKNRLNGANLRSQVRDAVYNAYTGNKVIATLEGTREFNSDDLNDLRKACCYAFADYICKLAGDYVDVVENPYYTVFESEYSNLAPGITQEIHYATSADDKQMVYYVATADLTRDDVDLFANYNNNDPAAGWAMQRVLDQANAAQAKYGDPESEHYIPNYNVIVSTNGAGYNMSTGEPGGLLVMNGVEYHPIDGNGFFGVLKDGTPVIGTTQEYNTIYKDQVRDGIAGFGATLVKDGEVCINRSENYYTSRASRTAVGITRTGKVVLMVLDGRQEPFSCGGSMEEIAQIMRDAGCVHAINLDGGGSTTYVAKLEGAEELSVVNRPSDGFARSVSASLMMVSTAPSSTAFDHAILETDTDYLTVGTSIQITSKGVSATGNTAELPEGITWAVSDDRWGAVTEDGVFTALRNGSVDVYLMQGEDIIGTKTLNVVFPDNVYFTRDNMDAVFGSKVTLPVKALYEGKEVAIQASDLTFTLSNAAAGVIEGFTFTAAEASGLKNVKVTAALATDEYVNDSITIALYKQGETSFDFDQAVGGDRQMAWDRQVSNATTEDQMTYNVIDPEKEMVTTYTFAIDMTQIPIPQQLSDLIYMLPGADAADASAWGFLMQLAERVSVLTEVKPVIQFDPNFDVDYTELKLINDYFTLTNTEFDEATNKLTMTLKWIDQTAAIPPETANPLCIVNGLKLTPKEDAAWSGKQTLTPLNKGQISYKVYLRASALYSFALKEENQKIYGLQPFVNPNDESEKGGWFGSVYAEFEDTYTLNNALKNGWVVEDGGYAYYVDNERLTGICEADGLYYDFGENGINVGKTPFTGMFYDESVKGYRYSKVGVLSSGWYIVRNEWHYFSSSTMMAVSGHIKFGNVYYDFEEDGRLVSGVWEKTPNGNRYWYGPDRYYDGWETIDGEAYYFVGGYCLTGHQYVRTYGDVKVSRWYNFGEDGIARDLEDGLQFLSNGNLYYIVDNMHMVGLHKVDGDYYFFAYAGNAAKGEQYAWETHCDLPCSTYLFGDDYKMVNGIILLEDGYYYYVNGRPCKTPGLTKIGDDYYFVSSKGRLATGEYYCWATNCDLPCGNYTFDEQGRMINPPAVNPGEPDEPEEVKNGLVQEEDGIYYYVDGKFGPAGITKIGDYYYFVSSKGRVAVGEYYCWATNCDIPCGTYEFDDQGRMINPPVSGPDEPDEPEEVKNGLVQEADGIYYYVDGKFGPAGITKIGDYYYFVSSKGRVAVGEYYCWATNCDIPCGTYEFDDQGRMINPPATNPGEPDEPEEVKNGLVQEADGIYYYVDGKFGPAGITKIGDYYYFVSSKGRVATGSYYCWATNCEIPCGTYEFDDQGRMLNPPGSEPDEEVKNGLVQEEDGIYYYVDGKFGPAGITKIGDYYYFVSSKGRVATGSYYCWATNCDIPCGSYEFDEQGRMINPPGSEPDEEVKNGLVQEVDGIYYYVDGKFGPAGITKIGDYYYFVSSKGRVATGSYYCWATNCDIPCGSYEFDDQGRMINPPVEDPSVPDEEVKNGLIQEEDGIYYYVDGKIGPAGLTKIGDYYYFVSTKGRVAVGVYYCWATNCDLPCGTYEFDDQGRMINPPVA